MGATILMSASVMGAAAPVSTQATGAGMQSIKPRHSAIVPRRDARAIAGNLSRRAGASGGNPSCPGCSPPLVFHTGNPVAGGLTGTAGHVTITPFYWAPAGFSYPANYKAIVNGYLANVAAASQKSTNVFSVSTQYYQKLGLAPAQPIDYVVSAGAEVDDASAFPAQGVNGNCVAADVSSLACVSDPALQAELTTRLNALRQPIDDAHIYMVMFPNHVETCLGTACSRSGGYCAYHNGAFVGPAGNALLYGNEPFPDLAACSVSQAPNGDSFADAAVSTLSHEANETITDWAGAWYDNSPSGFENGDECAYVYGRSLGSTGVPTDGSARGTLYNQVIGLGKYYTQAEFSNEDYRLGRGDVISDADGRTVLGCVQAEELPVAQFSTPAPVGVGVPAQFDGTTSSDPDGTVPLLYRWAWGDGSPDSSGGVVSHAFGSAGTYTVKLTVTDDGGWVASTNQPISVVITVPAAPSGVVATAGDGQANLIWTPPVGDGGSAITGYEVTPHVGSTAGSRIVTGSTGTSFTVPGLTDGTAYFFTVVAINSIGAGPASAPSNLVTPAYTAYFAWYDKSSSSVLGDNLHIVNPGPSSVSGTVSITGVTSTSWTAAPNGGTAVISFPRGTVGGPVTVKANGRVIASQRVQFMQSFNEIPAQPAINARGQLFFPWYDRISSAGFTSDNIHIVNPGSLAAHVTVAIPGPTGGCAPAATIGPGATAILSCATGFGGPVVVDSDQPVLASQRVNYFGSFNESWAEPASSGGTTLSFPWYDRISSPGFLNDNIHLVNPGATPATVTIQIPGVPVACSRTVSVAARSEVLVNCPTGFGGPVTISSNVSVLASQRVQYFDSFNEVPAQSTSAAALKVYFPWYDRISDPGFQADNIHLVNPGPGTAHPSVVVPGVPGGCTASGLSISPGAEVVVSCPSGFGGPVTVTSDIPVMASQRVQYYQSFNESAAGS